MTLVRTCLRWEAGAGAVAGDHQMVFMRKRRGAADIKNEYHRVHMPIEWYRQLGPVQVCLKSGI